MTRLNDLYDQQGQSPWLDNLRRDWLDDGRLAERNPKPLGHHAPEKIRRPARRERHDDGDLA